MNSVGQEIRAYVEELEIFDTHEHLPRFEELRETDTDLLKEYLLHYFNRDLVSAGMPRREVERLADISMPLAERWRSVEPYWELCRHTGYGRALDLAVQGLYDLPEISGKTIKEADRRFQASLQPGWFEHVLREKSRIAASVLDPKDGELACDERFFRAAHRLDFFVRPYGLEAFQRASAFTALRISSFDDWTAACARAFELAFQRGAVCLKIGLAYERPLSFRRVSRSAAEEQFNRLFDRLHVPDWSPARGLLPGRDLEDYMMHLILSLADKRGCVVQVHTGIQEGSGNLLNNSDPLLLSPLFLQYPNVAFDLFHMGYPFQGVVGVLAKNFPNVYADLCWAHIVSPRAARETLREWLEMLPLSKIFAFGGDYRLVDGVYGHQRIARANVSQALTQVVDSGSMSLERAKEAARLILRDNAMRVFAQPEAGGATS